MDMVAAMGIEPLTEEGPSVGTRHLLESETAMEIR